MAVSDAKRAANARFDEKTYRKLLIALRYEEDAEILESLAESKANGIPYRTWLTDLFYNGRPIESMNYKKIRQVLESHRIDVRTINNIMKELGE